jgi:hypothetical protein
VSPRHRSPGGPTPSDAAMPPGMDRLAALRCSRIRTGRDQSRSSGHRLRMDRGLSAVPCLPRWPCWEREQRVPPGAPRSRVWAIPRHSEPGQRLGGLELWRHGCHGSGMLPRRHTDSAREMPSRVAVTSRKGSVAPVCGKGGSPATVRPDATGGPARPMLRLR